MFFVWAHNVKYKGKNTNVKIGSKPTRKWKWKPKTISSFLGDVGLIKVVSKCSMAKLTQIQPVPVMGSNV